MEELTKQQIVLVTLLVSFITSIGTGIVTVALMDQAPPGVTQTINRVVERTIEKVVQGPAQQTASVITKETIVVKEDDLVVQAVEKNSKSIVSVIWISGEGDSLKDVFVGNGLVVGKDGLVAIDPSITGQVQDFEGNFVPQKFKVIYSDRLTLPVSIVPASASSKIIFLKPIFDGVSKPPIFSLASLADSVSLKLGQTVIALGGEKVSVATGIVSNLSEKLGDTSVSSTATSTADIVALKNSQIIKTDIHTIGKTLGSILVNLSSDVVGIRAISAGEGDNFYIPSGAIVAALAKVSAATTTASVIR
ncbi:MAG: serine protease [Candidatus Taylorbacteria bacterium]|nr:serine protease [Candidatus Taylorbacteria bacterium]